MTNPGERLRNYRVETLKFKTKREMAKYLGISEDVYSKAENGTRDISKPLFQALEAKTGLSEQYWKYGTEPHHINNSELKSTLTMLEQLLKDGDLKTYADVTDEVENMLLTALKADIQHILFSRNKK